MSFRLRLGALSLCLYLLGCPAAAPNRSEPSAAAQASIAPPPPLAPAREQLEYVEILTGGAKAGDALPVIVAIHGLGDEPSRFSALLADFPIAARVVLPRAPEPWQDEGFAWFRTRVRDDDPEALAAGIEGATSALAELLRQPELAAKNRKKFIVTGFSQGGILSFALALHHPELVAAAFPLAGWLPPKLWPGTAPAQTSPRIFALHGSDDPAVPHAGTEAMVQRLQQLGWSVELRTYPGVKHLVTPEMRADLHRFLAEAIERIP